MAISACHIWDKTQWGIAWHNPVPETRTPDEQTALEQTGDLCETWTESYLIWLKQKQTKKVCLHWRYAQHKI